MLKRVLSNKHQPLETLAFKRVFGTPEGEKVLEDLACRVLGRNITDDTSDNALRQWTGEFKLLKYILIKTYKTDKEK